MEQSRPNRSANPGCSAQEKGGAGTDFCLHATSSLQERRPRALKHGDTFAVFDHNGDAYAGLGSPEGIYHRDTRYLSELRLTINGERPLLLSSTLRDDNATLTCDLTNPDLHSADGQKFVEHGLVHLRRSRFLWNGASYERLSVRNFDLTAQRLRVEIAFAADFADLFEVRGSKREQRGVLEPPKVGRDEVVLAYRGLDQRRRVTRIRFDPAPDQLTAEQAVFDLELDSQKGRNLLMEVVFDHLPEGGVRACAGVALRQAHRSVRRAARRAASIETSHDIFNEAVRRSVSDLYMLVTETPEGPYPYAGIPWFSTVFGRDALITALQTLWFDPTIARGVLRHLAANQAIGFDPDADAEPGKIIHEVRCGEMAELKEVPFRKYYGSIDATPLFAMLAGAYLHRTGDLTTVRELWPHVQGALEWIDRYGDRDGDGFVEYGRYTDAGLLNQGWKDSHDSIFHDDGTLARGPIALVEVQAYVYGAWRAAAGIARALDQPERAAAYDRRAKALQQAFDDAFFDDELGTYVLALDGEKRPCRVRSSNAGHALLTGLALEDRVPSVVRTLMDSASFCGWGVRTIASGEARYNPISYHNGSVWPHDNSLIASGLANYGYKREAGHIFEGLFAASTYIDLRRLPELFCGFSRQSSRGPTFYPVACSPQAWAAAAPLYMLQSCLGLAFDPEAQRLMFNEPFLPPFLDRVVLRNLTIGAHVVDVALNRSGERVVADVLRREGSIQVVVVT